MTTPRPSDPLSQVGEEEILRFLRRRHLPGSTVAVGIGDDAALLRPVAGEKGLLVTTDLMVENVHFRRDGISPEDLGYKLGAVNVSDIAAMGGRPRHALLAAALPASLKFDFIRRLSRGLSRVSKKYGLELIGGDTTLSRNGIFLNLTLLGRLAGPRPLTRRGARAGDLLCVTGHLGASVLGCLALEEGREGAGPSCVERVVRRHRRPAPPVEMGAGLARLGLATAALDISDGLSVDLDRLCRESGLGAEVFAATLPLLPSTRRAGAILGSDALEAALHGGEEYELLFTVTPGELDRVRRLGRRLEVRVSVIGKVTKRRGVVLAAADGSRTPLAARGWKHFRKTASAPRSGRL